MIVPTRRWLIGGVLLSALAPLALVWPDASALFLLADAAWLGLFLLDGAAAGNGALDVTRHPPAAFSAGRTLDVEYRWALDRRRSQAIRVRELFPAPLGGASVSGRSLSLHPGITLERLPVMPVHRGRGGGGRIAVRRLGPLGLAWKQERFERPWEATVFPNLGAAAHRALPSRAARRREVGLRSMRRPGEGRLFESLREWIPGEDTRIIDWKATARRGKPIARVYEDERRQQVLLVLDAGRLLTAESDGVPRLEAAIGAALRLAHAAVEHDDDVGVLVFADTIQAFAPPRRGRRGLRAVLGALAMTEGRLVESDYPSAFRYLAARSRKRALTVLFTDVIDRTASAALVAQTASLRPRHLPLAVTLRDPALERVASARPETELAAFERAAAEELMLARDEALRVMRRQGVVVLDVPPAGAGDAVVEGYYRLKRRGLL
ncbi:MAG TPA: DUF58 domain-containing protein [Gemmatimonadales bacterium]|nr:DUF58 domain-containing protein [Gemmatimonadales bacterium]